MSRTIRLVLWTLIVLVAIIYLGMRRVPKDTRVPAGADGVEAVEAGGWDLSGNWDARLPSGAAFQPVLTHLTGARYRLEKCGVFSGVYELRGKLLVVVEPVDVRLTEFVWQVLDANTLLLVR